MGGAPSSWISSQQIWRSVSKAREVTVVRRRVCMIIVSEGTKIDALPYCVFRYFVESDMFKAY